MKTSYDSTPATYWIVKHQNKGIFRTSNTFSGLISKAKRFDKIGDAMREAVKINNEFGNVKDNMFIVYPIYV